MPGIFDRFPFIRASEALPELQVWEVIREGGQGRSTLTLVQLDGQVALLKNFARESVLFRRSLGWFMARREAAAYRRLAGVQGVPQLLGRRLPDGLMLEFFRTGTLARIAGEQLTQDFFKRLVEVLRDVRGSGVLHGDIGHNVLVTASGQPVLVDFGSSFVIPQWLPILRSTILRLGALHDELAVIKLKARSAPHLMTDSDQRLLARRLPFQWWLELGERVLGFVVKSLRDATTRRP